MAGKQAIRPVAAASLAVFHGDRVLLVKRGKAGPAAGRWSLPGGRIEPGEAACAAALREVREETGIEARILACAGDHEVILRDASGAIAAHYVISVFSGCWLRGEPEPASDVAAARFLSEAELAGLPLTEGLVDILQQARQLLQKRTS